ncbi:MAG: GDP-mannose 4,6-dehydratase [Synechococcaceae cyanobacterium]|nr:GDP-mannose 4,6-dehydratase [Synechococcaceae cyanobacterium]
MPSILITGGAGFIGVNAASHFASRGWEVSVLDNLSRRGTDQNLSWLLAQHPAIGFEREDVRDAAAMQAVMRRTRPQMVLHLAGQVAVTTSYTNPREDFEINALGTFNLLEAVRLEAAEAFVLNASTNKVYGGLESVPVSLGPSGWRFQDLPGGIPETQPLDFHSPYGCSKGVADQYTIDYARIYGLQTCSFRQSCIYGTRQFGIEDQGWVAWFSIAALLGRTITLYGDGWQTRDVLDVRDLVLAYEAAWQQRQAISGQAFNIGGGPANTLCLRELLRFLDEELGVQLQPLRAAARPGDQPAFVCSLDKAKRALGWQPAIGVEEGVRHLIRWVRDNRELFAWLEA